MESGKKKLSEDSADRSQNIKRDLIFRKLAASIEVGETFGGKSIHVYDN